MFVCCSACADGCKACGSGCTKCCRGCGRACDGCCNACEQACGGCWSFLFPRDEPSRLYAIFAVLIGLAIIVVSVVYLIMDGSDTCDRDMLRVWTGVMIPIGLADALFGLYLHWQLRRKLREGKGLAQSACRMLFFDVGVYFFLWIFVFQIVWICLSAKWNTDEGVCDAMSNYMTQVVLVIVFLVGGAFIMLLTICTECCLPPRWTNDQQYAVEPAGHTQAISPSAPQPVPMGYQHQAQVAPAPAQPSAPHRKLMDFFTAPALAAPSNYGTHQQAATQPPAVNPDFSV